MSTEYSFDEPALNIAQKIMECRATAAFDGWPDVRLKAAIQCLVIEAMKWAAPAAPAAHPLLSGVEWPHRRVIYVIEDPQRGDKRFIKDLEAAVLEQFEATTQANKKYSFGRNIADDSPMTDDQLADEARLTANPFQASNGVTVTWINATQYEPLKPVQHHNGMMQLSQRLAEAETARNDLWEELKRLRSQEPTYQLCMNPRSVAAQWLDVTKEQYEISDQKKRIVYKEASPAGWPGGWKLVPVEPTAEMMLHNSSCQHHAWDDKDCSVRQLRRNVWGNMISAAPAPGGDDA